MTDDDKNWVRKLIDAQVLDSPVLELGVGYGGSTSREMIQSAGLSYFGTDIAKTSAVDFVANFEAPEDMQVFRPIIPLGSILILNVLEHTFDPIRILDNALSLLKPGGKCAIITPTVWPLHNYPMDNWRLLPNFYEEYAKRRNLYLDRQFFEYVGIGRVEQFTGLDKCYSYPAPSRNKLKLLRSRIFTRSLIPPVEPCFIPAILP